MTEKRCIQIRATHDEGDKDENIQCHLHSHTFHVNCSNLLVVYKLSSFSVIYQIYFWKKGKRSSCWKALFMDYMDFEPTGISWGSWDICLMLLCSFQRSPELLLPLLLCHINSLYTLLHHIHEPLFYCAFHSTSFYFIFLLFMDIYKYTGTPNFIAALLFINTCPQEAFKGQNK